MKYRLVENIQADGSSYFQVWVKEFLFWKKLVGYRLKNANGETGFATREIALAALEEHYNKHLANITTKVIETEIIK